MVTAAEARTSPKTACRPRAAKLLPRQEYRCAVLAKTTLARLNVWNQAMLHAINHDLNMNPVQLDWLYI